MRPGPLSDVQVDRYARDGFTICRKLFSTREIDRLAETAGNDLDMANHAYLKADGEGGRVRMALWNHPGDDLYGMFSRSRRIVDAAEQVLDDQVYHYHSKLILKDANVGGAWTWHQDYGYWYLNGVLYPNMISVSIAIDAATKENGCMQVLRGSHLIGRIDHQRSGDQAGADMERVNAARDRLDLVYCEMEPGDALFFHCNLLHRSDMNRSDRSRWSLICCYNAKANEPFKASHHPGYSLLSKVEDDAIMNHDAMRCENETEWFDPNTNQSLARLGSQSDENDASGITQA